LIPWFEAPVRVTVRTISAAVDSEKAKVRQSRLLLVEDDDSIADPLVRGLERDGFVVARAATGARALDEHDVDLVLLDLGLPDMDGYDVCRQLRERSTVPIIILTARGDEIDRVLGLELGADDYVVKPFGLRELVARIRAVTRRTSANVVAERGGTGDVVELGPLRVDLRRRNVERNGVTIPLTRKEFDLLALLVSDPNATHRREDILDRVWDTNWYGPTKTLDVHIAALRKKIGDPGLIETVRGVGFRLRSGVVES
jgi:two-component system response regulator RegX3